MKDEALRLADEIAEMLPKHVTEPVAAELRRLHAENQRCRNVCDATSEGWRADAEEWKAQRGDLLEALTELVGHNKRFSGGVWDRARAVIKKAEEA